MIRLHALGALDLLDRTDGHQILSVLAQPKRVGVLTYLAIASPRGRHSRDALLSTFWPDSSDKRARNALNQTVFVLRRALGQDLFTKNGDVGLGVDDEHLWCDVWEFEKALEKGEKEDALDLYRGNFLDGFFLPGCLEFERWADGERSRLRDLATGAVLSLSREMEDAGNPVGAVGWLRRAREWAPYDELVLRRQLELLIGLGDRSGAVREYEGFARRLSVDLGMEPSEEIRDLLTAPVSESAAYQSADPRAWSNGLPSLLNGEPDRSSPWTRRRFSAMQTVLLAFLAIVLGIGGALWIPGLGSTTDTRGSMPGMEIAVRPRIAVLPLENVTGDPSRDELGRTAADQILQELASTGMASVGPLDAGGEEGADREGGVPTQRTIGNRRWTLTDAEFVVAGSLSDHDGSLAFKTRIFEAETGAILLSIDSVMGSFADPQPATDRLKEHVAGALAMVLDPDLSHLLGVATHPPSSRAYQLVSDGLRYLNRSGTGDQERFLEGLDTAKAAFLDAASSSPRFTLPLILALSAMPNFQADSVLEVLRPRRDQLPPWERAMLDFHLAKWDGDQSGQYEAQKRVVAITPTREQKFELAKVALRANRTRETRDLLSELGEDPGWTSVRSEYWAYFAETELLLGGLQEALGHLGKAVELDPDNAALRSRQVEVLARLGREEEAVQRAFELVESTGHVGTRFLRYHLPKVLIRSGLEEEGRRLAEVSLEPSSNFESVRPDYRAAILVVAERFDDARQYLEEVGVETLRPGYRMEAYTLLSFMAAREGRAEEARRFGEMASAVNRPLGVERAMYGVMAQAQAAAHLGDNAGAVRYIREAYRLGLPHGSYLFTRWDLRPLEGYKPFEDLMRPKG